MNRLASESSLYLRQHANNPVDWYAWGDEAIARARELDRPIFLSIGYSACHWCHVMEHESFEDEATAHVLNEQFVSIKVDREERPDIDHIYMTALQVMSREGGGWPLSVWLTPDLQPFYAGTYFPPDERYAPSRPSFKRLLAALAEAWHGKRQEIREQSATITRHLREMVTASSSSTAVLTVALLENAVATLKRSFDPIHGGFGNAPKFPHALELRLLLRMWKRTGQNDILHLVRASLDGMAAGGIYDQIGGGFHRYSTDARWLVPHFEKMLYDNALLASAYTDAWLATKVGEYRRITVETLDYVLREMTSLEGAMFSTQDADSEGEEGKFYVWSQVEIESVLGIDEAAFFNHYYNVSNRGNFEGHNILHRQRNDIAPTDRLKASATKLYAARAERIWPGRDEKILASWNGLMIAALAHAGTAFGEVRFVDAAARAADFVLERMRAADGSLYRTCAVGSPPRIPAYLEDYACLIVALVELYSATFEPRWIEEAVRLAEAMIAKFADPKGGGFFSTEGGQAHLIARSKDSYDGSTPSGNSMAVTGLLQLGRLTGRNDLIDQAERTLCSYASFLDETPSAASQMLSALDFDLGLPTEFVVIGSAEADETRRVLKGIREEYRPNKIVLFHDPANGAAPTALLPLLIGKTGGTNTTVYICRNGTCSAPLQGLAAFEEKMAQPQ